VKPNLTFFLDRTIGRHDLPERLRKLGLSIEIHYDHFRPDESDVVWISEIGERGWVVLSGDKKIGRKVNEILEIITAKVKMFILADRKPSPDRHEHAMRRHLESIKVLAEYVPPPFMVKVTSQTQGIYFRWLGGRNINRL